MQSKDPGNARAQQHGQHRGSLGLERAERNVRHQQGICEIHAHVQRLPDGRRQVVKPEVVARCRHQKQDHQCDKTEDLKRKSRDACVAATTCQYAHDWVTASARVKLHDRERAMCQRHREHRDAHVPPVVQQRQETPVQAA
jgi:hypothetical protein